MAKIAKALERGEVKRHCMNVKMSVECWVSSVGETVDLVVVAIGVGVRRSDHH